MIVVTAPRLSVVLIALALAGCGAVPSSHAPSKSPNVSAVQITDSDNGRAVSLAVGEQMEVTLHEPPGYMRWQQPVSSDTSVLQPLPPSSGAPAPGTTAAAFVAQRVGHADLVAAAPFACSPGAYCPAIAQTWRLKVTVS